MSREQIFRFFSEPLFVIGDSPITLAGLARFVIVIVVVVLVARVSRRALRTRLLSRTKLDLGLQYAISRIFGYVVLVLGFIIGLSALGVDLTSLAVLAGALGIGIGFGLQNIVSNFVSGLIILMERPIQLGDRVDVGGTTGDVLRIGGRSTSILTNDNIVLIVPNSEFISGRVVNWTQGGDPRVRLRIPVGVSYGSDVRLVQKALLETAQANSHVLKEPAPSVRFHGFGDSSLNFELLVWTIDMSHRPGSLRSELNFAIWDAFKKAGIAIPFPQRDLHLKEPVRVELSQPG